MARYWINGGVDSLWNSISNWSDTSGGTGGFSVPTTTDDVFFDNNSPLAVTTNGSRTVLSLDFTGWSGTLTFSTNNTMTMNGGNLTLSATMTIVNNGNNVFASAIGGGTFTSNGISVTRLSLTGNTQTHTLADTWTVTDLCTLGSSGSQTVNGGSIICQGSLTTGGSTTVVTGTTTIILAGTGTWTGPTSSGSLRLPVTINTAGTITLGTRIGFGAAFTYTTGTIITTSSTFDITGAAATLDCAGITFNNISLQGTVTHTLNANIYVDGLTTLSNSSNTTTVNGNTIFARGGVRFACSTGLIQGTTVVYVEGTQTLDAPSRTTACMMLPLLLDAPTGTITVDTGFFIRLSHFDVTSGTTVVTNSGTWVGG